MFRPVTQKLFWPHFHWSIQCFSDNCNSCSNPEFKVISILNCYTTSMCSTSNDHWSALSFYKCTAEYSKPFFRSTTKINKTRTKEFHSLYLSNNKVHAPRNPKYTVELFHYEENLVYRTCDWPFEGSSIQGSDRIRCVKNEIPKNVMFHAKRNLQCNYLLCITDILKKQKCFDCLQLLKRWE